MNVYDVSAILCSGVTLGSIFFVALTDDGTNAHAAAYAMMYASCLGTLMFNREARKSGEE